MFGLPETVQLTSPVNGTLLSNPSYLRIHAACCKIAHELGVKVRGHLPGTGLNAPLSLVFHPDETKAFQLRHLSRYTFDDGNRMENAF